MKILVSFFFLVIILNFDSYSEIVIPLESDSIIETKYQKIANDILTVEFVMFNGKVVDKIGIYDLNGRLLLSRTIDKSYGLLSIDVRSLAHGTYIVAFGDAGVSKNSKKFVANR